MINKTIVLLLTSSVASAGQDEQNNLSKEPLSYSDSIKTCIIMSMLCYFLYKMLTEKKDDQHKSWVDSIIADRFISTKVTKSTDLERNK